MHIQLITALTVLALSPKPTPGPGGSGDHHESDMLGVISKGPRLNTDLVSGGNWSFVFNKGDPPDGAIVGITLEGGQQVDVKTLEITSAGAIRAKANGQLVWMGAFEGSTWSFVVANQVVEYVIEDISVVPKSHWNYRFVEPQTNTSMCLPDDSQNDALRFFPGVSIHNGEVVSAPSNILAACESGAAAKAGAFVDPTVQPVAFQAMLRLIRADFCGNGTSYTQAGTEIYIDDASPWCALEDIEAVWDEDGALCLSEPRLESPPCSHELPPCTKDTVMAGAYTTHVVD